VQLIVERVEVLRSVEGDDPDRTVSLDAQDA
jgi:hypothetical protein